MAAIPYMPFYVADYLADAAHLSTVQHGAYLLLIFNYWQRGEPLPDSDRKLARIVGLPESEWMEIREDIAEFFVSQDGCWSHRRIDAELEHVRAKSTKARDAGKASAKRRANAETNERSADAEQTLNGRSTPVQQTLNECSADAERTLNHADADADADAESKSTAALPPGLDEAAWTRWVQYRREIRKPIKPASMLTAQRKLAGLGADQAASIEEAIAHGYQGFFPPKNKPPDSARSGSTTRTIQNARDFIDGR